MMDALDDYTEVPYLNELLSYLPIDAIDKEDITTYIQNIIKLVTTNYKYEQYQFAYFGLHLLFMIYIYSTVWKISKISEERYVDTVIFARAYNNRKLDLCNIESIFEYSLIPEKELPKILKLIDLDQAQIINISGLVDDRNDMAHATGKFDILTEEKFKIKAHSICTSIRNIHKCLNNQIRIWFQEILIRYSEGEFDEYSQIRDIIFEQMIQQFYLSVNELLICNEMSIHSLLLSKPERGDELKKFKIELKNFCEIRGYI